MKKKFPFHLITSLCAC